MSFQEYVTYSAPGWLAVLALFMGWAWTGLERRKPSRSEMFVPWGGLDVLVAIATYSVLMFIAVGALTPWLKHAAGQAGWAESAATAVPGLGTVIVVFALLHHRYGLWARDVGLAFGRWGRDLLLAATLFAVVLAGRQPMMMGFEALREHFGKDLQQQEFLTRMQSGPTAELLFLAFVGLALAPFYEEVVFRGFLQPALGRIVKPWWSILIVAAAFSCLHSPTSPFFMTPIMIFPLALALGYARWKTGRLAAPIMIHLMNNFLAVLAIVSQRGPSAQ